MNTPPAEGDGLSLEIESLNSSAEGVGRYDGLAVFVPGALPGDSVRASVVKKTKHFARARLDRLDRPSPDRLSARCPHHIAPNASGTFPEERSCGGCLLQTYDRALQLEAKRRTVADTLSRIGGFSVEVSPTRGGNPWRYRNKMAFVLAERGGELAWGLRSLEDGGIAVPLSTCEIAREEIWSAGEKILERLNERFDPSLAWDGEKGFIRAAALRFHTGLSEGVNPPLTLARTRPTSTAVFAVTEQDAALAERIAETLEDIQDQRVFFTYSDPRTTGVFFDRGRFLNRPEGRPPKWGEGKFREEICAWHQVGPWPAVVGPTTFLQVNDEMAEALYRRVLELPFESNGFAVDTYCGVGILTRALADRFEETVGVELDTQSIKLARAASRRLDDRRVEWIAEPAESLFGRSGEFFRERGRTPDLVVLDPPRKGCQKAVLGTLVQLRPKDLVYIGCHPAALARDLAILCKRAFEIVSVEPFDLFPQTHHVETLVHLKATGPP